mmetsp:Transcript_116789/g.337401  ORF Transcript_116789/g.337401 Transcript_116789/m.337401 type:complete len:431 (+) Transcript_116789:114-1406(+)
MPSSVLMQRLPRGDALKHLVRGRAPQAAAPNGYLGKASELVEDEFGELGNLVPVQTRVTIVVGGIEVLVQQVDDAFAHALLRDIVSLLRLGVLPIALFLLGFLLFQLPPRLGFDLFRKSVNRGNLVFADLPIPVLVDLVEEHRRDASVGEQARAEGLVGEERGELHFLRVKKTVAGHVRLLEELVQPLGDRGIVDIIAPTPAVSGGILHGCVVLLLVDFSITIQVALLVLLLGVLQAKLSAFNNTLGRHLLAEGPHHFRLQAGDRRKRLQEVQVLNLLQVQGPVTVDIRRGEEPLVEFPGARLRGVVFLVCLLGCYLEQLVHVDLTILVLVQGLQKQRCLRHHLLVLLRVGDAHARGCEEHGGRGEDAPPRSGRRVHGTPAFTAVRSDVVALAVDRPKGEGQQHDREEAASHLGGCAAKRVLGGEAETAP